jgi:hypothetical protein
LEEPSLSTIFKEFIYIYFAVTCFGPRWPSSGGIHNIFGKIPHCSGSINFPKIIVYSAWRWPARTETYSGEININKHNKKLLGGTVLPIKKDKERAIGCRTPK